jgi:SAM-dependent methyltransferase
MPEKKRVGGKTFEPQIDKWLPEFERFFGGKLKLFGNDSVVLDTAMGYGVDISWLKKEFPGLIAYGIDLNIRLDDKNQGKYEFSYSDARDVVEEALGRDVLPECKVYHGDALMLDGPLIGLEDEILRGFPLDSLGYFTRVLSIGLIHHLERPDRIKSFRQAYRVMRERGVLLVVSLSGEGLEPFTDLKGEYEMIEEPKTLYGRPKLRRGEKKRLGEDLDLICERLGINPKENDKKRFEQIATSPFGFNVAELKPKYVKEDLESAGFKDVIVPASIKVPGYNVCRELYGIAIK